MVTSCSKSVGGSDRTRKSIRPITLKRDLASREVIQELTTLGYQKARADGCLAVN